MVTFWKWYLERRESTSTQQPRNEVVRTLQSEEGKVYKEDKVPVKQSGRGTCQMSEIQDWDLGHGSRKLSYWISPRKETVRQHAAPHQSQKVKYNSKTQFHGPTKVRYFMFTL